MIKFEIGGEYLEVNPDTTLQVAISNPLFNEELESGLITYDVTLKQSRRNKRLTRFAGMLNRQVSGKDAISCNLWLAGQLFRVGKLNVLEAGEKETRVNFVSDAGAIAEVKEDLLSEIDLGLDNLTLSVKPEYPQANYALFPLKNPGFYGSANPAFLGYLNYYQTGGFKPNGGSNQYSIVPFPYLAYVLERVFSKYGFRLTGDWIQSAETRRQVIYNTYALDKLALSGINQFETAIDFRNHVPKVKVSEFLKDLRIMQGLAYIFRPNSREVEPVQKSAVLADPEYLDWTGLVVPGATWNPNDRNGFILQQKEESSDLEHKLIAEKLKFQVGKGKDTYSTGCSYVNSKLIIDEIHGSRRWLVPVADQKGNSPEFGLGTKNNFSFRLLNYHGLQPDLDGGTYPMASFSSETAAALNIGNNSLAWEGPKGLYLQAHKDWLDFLETADQIIMPVRLGVAQLSLLDPCRKVLIRTAMGTIKALWQKIEFDVHATKGIKTAKVTFFKVAN